MMVQVLRILTIILSMCACLETRKMKNKSDENKGTVDIDWSYLYGQDTGPDTWADNYPDCGGPLQTPIDLPAVKDLTSSSSKPLVLKGYNKKPKKQFLKNDGRTAKLEGKYKKPPTMSILNKTYTFVQLHFHWGEYDDLGSEHTVDGEAFPLEIHFVHQSKDGSLAVLGVFADIDDEYPRDSVLYPLWDEFVEIEEAGDKLRLKNRDMIVIDDFLPDDLSSYYSRGLVPHPDGQNGVFNSTSANFLNDPNIDPSKARHSDQIRLAELNPFILKKCRSSHTDDINQPREVAGLNGEAERWFIVYRRPSLSRRGDCKGRIAPNKGGSPTTVNVLSPSRIVTAWAHRQFEYSKASKGKKVMT
ncbi:carbonic anhydrase 1-like [Oratosquilla oratoria]|uniref:carbonic anhydrase 1-like n=1 Tax=Oratosquilla oratoria TaxID=337810 RepID=UPI003F76D341